MSFSGERQQLLYPGDKVADLEDFYALRDRFVVPTTAPEGEYLKWEHGDFVQQLLGRRALVSPPAEVIDASQDIHFSKRLETAKRSSTIHMPETDYAIPPWAAHFGDAILKILTHEHATNPRADHQVAQIRVRQYRGQLRNTRPHLDMIGSNVRNFHFYLAADNTPTTTFGGEFDYEPRPDLVTPGDPLEFFRDLDRQFAEQLDRSDITTHTPEPYDISVLSAATIHRPPATMPHGRTLFGIQFYEVDDSDKLPTS